MKLCSLIGLFSFLLTGCTPWAPSWETMNAPAGQSKIMGGEVVEPGSDDARSVVMITLDSTMASTICTGTVVAQKWILTAAHCVDLNTEHMRVFTGSSPFKSSEAPLDIEKVFVFNPSHLEPQESHDIALVQLKNEFPKSVVIAKLPNPNISFVPQVLNLKALGYGIDQDILAESAFLDFLNGSGQLRKLTLNNINYVSREKSFRVSQKNSQGVCFGDSGGPAFLETPLERTVMGVASQVTPSQDDDLKECSDEAVYSNVFYYLNWIQATTGRSL